ncbi:MAG: 50S ribosomal protein L29 [Gemmatimonadetes bacterium]|jgi:large subunit ribosomal protein L29|nr:50S ribosomal protein L29 [Gemmatimonadota bacterium]MBI70357.1 50S ribosomal protein L29 [Gemmatimonadota bacterium]|tara:strand:- start:160 stop:378 length:219 start_codon:yes stop_codon:yes gene_type:complete
MKVSEIREWDNVEISARLEELKEDYFRMRFQAATMTLDNPKILKGIRRDVARLKTVLREREASANSKREVQS